MKQLDALSCERHQYTNTHASSCSLNKRGAKAEVPRDSQHALLLARPKPSIIINFLKTWSDLIPVRLLAHGLHHLCVKAVHCRYASMDSQSLSIYKGDNGLRLLMPPLKFKNLQYRVKGKEGIFSLFPGLLFLFLLEHSEGCYPDIEPHNAN